MKNKLCAENILLICNFITNCHSEESQPRQVPEFLFQKLARDIENKERNYTQVITDLHGRALGDRFLSPTDVDSGRNTAALVGNVEPSQQTGVSFISC